MALGPAQKEHAQLPASNLTGALMLAILCLSGVMFCIAGIGYAGMPPVHGVRAHFRLNIHGQSIHRGPKESYSLIKGNSAGRARAAILVLARNEDCDSVLLSMQRMERRFNHKFQYPYVFLNNAPFEAVFQERYFSGFFQHHPLLQQFDYYWRMEPDVHYYCDLDYDPFIFMQERGIKYGFTIAAIELLNTIPMLWNATLSFMAEAQHFVAEDNLLSFVTGQHGEYNLCHFWSNFEIGDLRFFRTEAYQEYFSYLDRQGGFFWERWGDAPVHTLAAAMFLGKSEVHHFQDIGYRHNSMKHCPSYNRNNCACDALEAVEFHTPSYGRCHAQWEQTIAGQPWQT